MSIDLEEGRMLWELSKRFFVGRTGNRLTGVDALDQSDDFFLLLSSDIFHIKSSCCNV